MGYFSEMSLDMQEGRKPSAASLTRECAFEDRENFDELPVPPADRQPVPPAAEPAPQPAFEDDGDLDEAPEELEQPDEAESPAEKTDEEDNADEGQAEPAKADASNADADEEQRRAEHEAAEAKRKAEWEAKQAEKKKALQEQMDRLAAMSDDEVVAASMQRVSGDVEKLTRRNMKECVSEYLQGNDKAIEALRRIVQAELMGQFYALKYFADDLQREIRYPISEVQEAAWKRNLTLERGPFSAEEADDFYFTMRLGELPHSTCLSCWTGSQRDCLLAAFDSNKKMILIRKGEDIVARACIRLTKGAFQRPADFDFSFADLAQEQPAGKMGASDEMLILFLERIYTSGLNDEEAETAMKMAVSLVTQKAAAIGAVAVLARRYQDCYDRDQYIGSQFYVYISKSKNGQQYLDSMGGAAVTSHKEQYTGTVFLVEQAAMRTAAPQKEDKSYE